MSTPSPFSGNPPPLPGQPPPIPDQPPPLPGNPIPAGEKSSTGVDVNLAALLTYLLGFITGVAFLVIEKDSRYVRFHAMQSTIVFGGLFALNILLGLIPLLGWLFSFLLIPVTFVLWIVLMFKAYQGEKFKLPYIGDMAEQQLR